MANIENNLVDTRTFAEICAGLTKRQWVELQGELAQKVKRSSQTIYNWRGGRVAPGSALERKTVSDHINRKLGITTRHWTLFPEDV